MRHLGTLFGFTVAFLLLATVVSAGSTSPLKTLPLAVQLSPCPCPHGNETLVTRPVTPQR